MEINLFSQSLKAIADPLRLRILRVLGASSYGVLELTQAFAVKQSGMSHHLKTLLQAGWVEHRREGNSLYYRRSLQPKEAWRIELLEQIDSLQLEPALELALQEIEQQRVDSAREFFQKNAERFQEHQDLIAEYRQYGDDVQQALLSVRRPSDQRVIEVGPGEGEFLHFLCQHFDEVIAVELSSRMLQRAQRRLVGIENIHWLEGTLQDLLSASVQADLVVYNMVLHHVPSPAQEFVNSASKLKVGGRLIITDLCLHQQDWAREKCGDLWLGFDESQLGEWARQAGLEPKDAQYLGLRNGFQIQIQIFEKNGRSL